MPKSIVSMLVVSVALLVVLLTACSDAPSTTETATPTSTPSDTPTAVPTAAAGAATPTSAPSNTPTAAPTAAALSLEEYLSACSGIEEGVLEDDTTYGELSAGVEETIEKLSPLAPPAEVAEWHNLALELARALKDVYDSQPENMVVGIEFWEMLAELESLIEATLRAENDLPAEIGRQMAEAGCTEDPSDAPAAPPVPVLTPTS